MQREIVFRGQNYPSVFDIPIVRRFQEVKGRLYRDKGNTGAELDIIAREFNGGKTFLAYQGTTLIPGGDSQFLAQRSATIASSLGHTGHFTAIDVGTGTGIFATYLAEALADNPESEVVATDISGAALVVAERNFTLNGLRRPPTLKKRDMLTDIQLEFGRVNLIVSNPPFAPSARVAQNGFEPVIANDGGKDGIDFYRKLLEQSLDVLAPNSVIVLQITQISLARVVSCIGSILPSADIGYFINPNTGKVCGLIIGNKRIIEQFSTGLIN